MSKALEAATLAVKLEQARQIRYSTAIGEGINTASCRPASDALKLMRLSASLNALETEGCNMPGGLIARKASRANRIREQIAQTMRPYGLKFSWRTDDRGFPLFIHFPDGSYNTFGGSEAGWGI